MAFAQAKQQENADTQYNLARAYWVGETVWLNTRGIITHGMHVKLDLKGLGPGPIIVLARQYAWHLELG
jgi:hypothetical protein